MLKEQLAEYLHRYHHGAENAVTSKELEHTFCVSGKELRDIVNSLRREGIPIASDRRIFYAGASEPADHPPYEKPYQRDQRRHRRAQAFLTALTIRRYACRWRRLTPEQLYVMDRRQKSCVS